jgi:hypothetical protein
LKDKRCAAGFETRIGDAVVGREQADVLGLPQLGDERILLANGFSPVDCVGVGRDACETRCGALWSLSAARISVFNGTQPIFTQVSPMVRCL